MRLTISIAATLAVCAYSNSALAQSAADTMKPAAPAATPAPSPAPFQLDGTSWTYTYKNDKLKESIDPNGKYITQTLAGKHFDHGTAVMKGDKACFTSLMNKEGEVCWTTKSSLKIGESFDTTSDKGEKLTVTRVDYTPLSMPK